MSKSLLTPHGFSSEIFEGGEIVMMNLYTCCHCQYTWEAETGSLGGKLAGGFCGRCVGYICKNPDCLKACIPWEQRLENEEAGKHRLAPRRLLLPTPDMNNVKPRKVIDTSKVPDMHLIAKCLPK
jgi:hypothetical protein